LLLYGGVSPERGIPHRRRDRRHLASTAVTLSLARMAGKINAWLLAAAFCWRAAS
jgi:hypothetical protein